MRENVTVQFKMWHDDGLGAETIEKVRTRLIGFDVGIGSIDAINIGGDPFAQVKLTGDEHKLLGLVAARGEIGVAAWRDPHKWVFAEQDVVNAHGTHKAVTTNLVVDVMRSLERFGYVAKGTWDKDLAARRERAGFAAGSTHAYTITPAGLARLATYRTGGNRHLAGVTCPGCIQTQCVCSYSMSCAVHGDPLADPDLVHANLGCHGTHD